VLGLTSKLVDIKMQMFIKIDQSICAQIEKIKGIEIIG